MLRRSSAHETAVRQISGTICLAVYRPDLSLLQIQIDSIKAQTLKSWTCLIGIDGRDDEVTSKVAAIVAGDERFVVVPFEQNVGFYRNFERILAHADVSLSWIALADQDDRWYPHRLQELTELLAADPHVTAALAQARVVDSSGGVSTTTSRHFGSLVDLVFNNMVTGSFAVVRPEVLRMALPFPDPTDVAYHDHWVGLCAAMSGVIRSTDEPLQDYVQHAGNVVGEAQHAPIRSRWHRIGSAGSSARGRVRYIRQHRWGWRREIVRTAIARMPASSVVPNRELKDLGLIARGRPSIRLTYLIVRSVARRATPPSRGAAHLVGMLATRKKHVQ